MSEIVADGQKIADVIAGLRPLQGMTAEYEPLGVSFGQSRGPQAEALGEAALSVQKLARHKVQICMRTRVAAAPFVAALVVGVLMVTMMLGGCTTVQNNGSQAARGSQGAGSGAHAQTAQTVQTPFPWQKGMELTDDLERVAGTLGFTEDDIEQMRADGVGEASWRLLAPALAAEEHMGEKYGIGFTAIDCYYNLTDDQVGRSACMVRVSPQGGEHAGGEYLVRCDWTEDAGNPVWTEGYLAAARASDYAAYIGDLMAPGLVGLDPQPVISAQLYEGEMFGDDEGPDTPIEGIARTHMGDLAVYVRRTDGMTEEDFIRLADAVLDAARATGLRFYVVVGCIDRLGSGQELTPEVGAGAMRNRDVAEAEHLLPMCVWRRSAAVGGAGGPSEAETQAAA